MVSNLSIKYKILISLSILLFVFASFVAWFFPKMEKDILTNEYNLTIDNLSKALSVGLEVSFNNNDLDGIDQNIEKIFNIAKNDKRVEFIVVLTDGEVFVTYPKNLKYDKKTYNKTKDNIIKSQKITTKILNGEVIIGMSTKQLNETINKSTLIAISVGFTSLVLGIFVALYLVKQITQPLNSIVDAATNIANGNFNYLLARKNNDEISKVEDALDLIVNNIQNLIQKFDYVTNELIRGNFDVVVDSEGLQGKYLELNTKLHSAIVSTKKLINVSPNINLMIGDIDGNIVFLNDSVKNLFRKNQTALQKDLPQFNIDNLVGQNIDIFHKNPSHQHNILNNLKGNYQSRIEAAGKIFAFSISINTNAQNEKIGYIVEWSEVTSLANFERRLQRLIDAVANGDLSYRINYENIEGSYLDTTHNINKMLDNIQVPFKLTNSYLNDISNGLMPEKISKHFEGDFNTSKEAINTLIDINSSFITEMRNLYDLHQAGYINQFMDESQFVGFYKEMVIGVNENVKAHIDTMKNALNVFAEFGNGNFKADIELLPNDKRFINNIINQGRDNLFSFNQEILSLLNAAKNGNLSYKASIKGFQGGWREMAVGLNDLMNEISSPLTEASKVIENMSKGDLTSRIYGNYNGQFEIFKNNLNHLCETLEQVIKSVIESVHITSSTANQLAMTAENMSTAAQEQSAQTDDVATAVEQMSRTISDNAQSSVRTLVVAEKNGQIANEGGEVVGLTVSKMKDIALVVQKSAKNIEKLGNSSIEIGEIISVIDDIADQTNLLALNAAIEAARAGDQGRGFAVVADEVRKLAERTTDATKRIATMIKGIQSETTMAVTEMNNGNIEVQNGINLADKAGISLQEILSSSNEVYQMINQISAASEEQSATSEQISKNVISISRVISDSAMQIEEIAKSSEDLSKQTQLLTEILSQFKISNNKENYSLGNNSNNKLSNINTLKMLS